MKNIVQKLILTSFILAILSAGAFYGYLQSLKVPTNQPQKITILVATETIPPRTLIDRKMIKEIEVLDDSIFQAYISETNQIVGKYTRETILKNEGFHRYKLMSDTTEDITLMIKNNHRAVSIGVTADSGVAHLIKPGDFVDILVFLSEKTNGGETVRPEITKLILQNIQILGIDKNLHRDNQQEDKDKENIPTYFLVTLSTPISELEKLYLAESIGTLKLALRAFRDNSTDETRGATWEELISLTGNSLGRTLQTNSNRYTIYTIKQGDTLKIISRSFYGHPDNYSLIKKFNNIKDENLIVVGQVIKIPVLD